MNTKVPEIATDEQVRAFALEMAARCRDQYMAAVDVLAIAKMFEDYINTGELDGEVIKAIYEEGASEARFEVKEAVGEHFGGRRLNKGELDELFRLKRWINNS